jgi:VWFA-related protein
MTRKTIGTIAAAMALAAAVRAAPQTPPQAPPAFRGSTDLVEVDVVVQDRNGAFVSDLALEDFDVQEEGRPQQIQQLYLHVTDTPNRPVGRTLSGQANRPSMGGESSSQTDRRLFVVVFDDAHMTPSGFKRTQDAATTLFSRQFHDGDVGGIVMSGRMVNNRLTSDREELLKALRNAKPNMKSNARLFEERAWPRMSEIEAVRIVFNSDSTVLDEAVRRACADDRDQCRVATEEVQSKAQRLANAGRAESAQTLQILKTLMDGLAKIEGRKTVLLMSEGFVAEEAWPQVQDAVSLAARANARIYTLDARGLDRGMSDRLGGANPGVDDGGNRLLQQLDFGADSINSLAVDTGGFASRNTNIFDKAIAQIAADAGNYYVLGYRPTAMFDGKFHRISVKVKRPGLVVRARRGYVASPRPSPAEPRRTDSSTAIPPGPESVGDGLEAVPASAAAAAAIAPTAASSSTLGTVSRPSPTASTASTPTRLRPDALTHVETLVKDAPVNAAATTGWEAYQRGDLERARASLAVAAAGGSARPWVHYALGQAQYGLKDYAGAVAAWERVRDTTPEFEPVYFDLVDGYLQQKEYDKAIRVMRDARGRWPLDPEVVDALGVAQIWRGALDAAVESFEQAITLSPSDATRYFNLGKALELRYRASRRYVQQLRSWVANENDRTNAIINYQRYLAIGGPLDNASREGLIRLGWMDKP